jgi:hypothetical protein
MNTGDALHFGDLIRRYRIAALRAALGEERVAAARDAGRALTVEQAIAEARTVASLVMARPI